MGRDPAVGLVLGTVEVTGLKLAGRDGDLLLAHQGHVLAGSPRKFCFSSWPRIMLSIEPLIFMAGLSPGFMMTSWTLAISVGDPGTSSW